MANEKGLMGKIIAMMTDDKGIFQGGRKNRMFGRVRDAMEGTPEEGYNLPPAAKPLTPMRDTEPMTSPEFKTFMNDRTPENLRAWQLSQQPGGTEEYNRRLKKLLDEGVPMKLAQSNAWDYWGSENSKQFKEKESFDFERKAIDEIRMEDYRKYRKSGDRTKYASFWGRGNEPTLYSTREVFDTQRKPDPRIESPTDAGY